MRNQKSQPKLSKVPFTLPLSGGSSPFCLSEKEKMLRPDDWAWLFLRLNPLYQHDYALWLGRRKAWATPPIPYRLRPNGRATRLLRPEQRNPTNEPRETTLPSQYHPLPAATKNLDSRYFTIVGEPLTGEISALVYGKQTLGEYIEQHPKIDLGAIHVREFDAPRDFGIGAWVDPQMPNLPKVHTTLDSSDSTGSWFYHVNEPIWQVNTLAFTRPKISMTSLTILETKDKELAEGTVTERQHIDFGNLQFTCVDKWTRAVRKGDSLVEVEPQRLQNGMPIPIYVPGGLKASQFQFLVCLDGYVRPQLAMVFRIANAFKDLHKKHHPQSVQRGAPSIAVEIEVLPNANGSGMGLYRQLMGPAVRIRKNWRVVTIDVAAALIEQKEYVERALLQQQKELGDQLTFPLRHRPRGEDYLVDNPLKRALCVYELHKHGTESQGNRLPLSQMRINYAMYCEDMPEYFDIRGEPIPPSVANARVTNPKSDALDRVREGLELGRNLVQGWYEFVASRQFEN